MVPSPCRPAGWDAASAARGLGSRLNVPWCCHAGMRLGAQLLQACGAAPAAAQRAVALRHRPVRAPRGRPAAPVRSRAGVSCRQPALPRQANVMFSLPPMHLVLASTLKTNKLALPFAAALLSLSLQNTSLFLVASLRLQSNDTFEGAEPAAHTLAQRDEHNACIFGHVTGIVIPIRLVCHCQGGGTATCMRRPCPCGSWTWVLSYP